MARKRIAALLLALGLAAAGCSAEASVEKNDGGGVTVDGDVDKNEP